MFREKSGAAWKQGYRAGKQKRQWSLSGKQIAKTSMYEAWVIAKRKARREIRESGTTGRATRILVNKGLMSLGNGLREWVKLLPAPVPAPIGDNTGRRLSREVEDAWLRESKVLRVCSRMSCPKRCKGRDLWQSCPPAAKKEEEG